MKKVYVIAEAGINHNGNPDLARQMIDAAVAAEADAVKFQVFKAESVVSRYAPKAEYQKKTTGADESQLEMAKKLELSQADFISLSKYCRKKKIQFLATPFDFESIDFLQKMGVDIFKIPSGEITNKPYLQRIGKFDKKIILSTGMASLVEVENAINIIVLAGTHKNQITILHCNTEYPTDPKDVNLLAMKTMQSHFSLDVGYSDHTLGISVAIGAVALGASVIEKHFTLDKNMVGPDHQSSLDPIELKQMVSAIRAMEMALGDGIKKASLSESRNKNIVRKSIVAAKEIQKGEIFTINNITTKRPGTGLSPMDWDHVIGKTAKKSFSIDEFIEL